jgi:hypothetical protein
MSFSYEQPNDVVKMKDFVVINYLRCDKCGMSDNYYYYRPAVDMCITTIGLLSICGYVEGVGQERTVGRWTN